MEQGPEEQLRKYSTQQPFQMLADQLCQAMHKPAPKPRFDGTVNLGHILTLLGICGGMVTVYVQGKVDTSRLDSRITYLEKSQDDMSKAIRALSEAQATSARSQERLSAAIEWFVKPQQTR